MSTPFDGGRETYAPIVEDRVPHVPGDAESAALEPGVRHIAAPEPESRTTGALADAADVRGEVRAAQGPDDMSREVRNDGVEQGGDLERRPRIPIQKAVTHEVVTAEDTAALDFADETAAAGETVQVNGEDARRVGELAMNGVANTDTAAGEDDDAELDLEFDEDKDFDTRPGDVSRAPTDLVEAYKQDLNVEILNREQVIERSKDVEAGLTAGWVLRVNEAVDSPDDEALLQLREEYIEARQENMRLGTKDGEEGDSGDTADAAAPDGGAEAGLSKSKQIELAAERAREEKLRLATDEADELIALGLRFRTALQPDKTELPDETRRDLETMVNNGVRAKGELIESVQKWGFKESLKYTGKAARKGISQADLIQEGNLGIIRAVEKFDYTKGFTLSTYSTGWIRQTVERAINTGDTIRKPQHVSEVLARVHKAEEGLRARLQPGEELTEEMVAKAARLKPEKLAELRQIDHVAVSLDRPLGGDDDEGGATIGDMYRDKEADALDTDVAERDRMELLREAVRDALAGVNDDRIERIMRDRFGLSEDLVDGKPRTLDEIAKREGVTRERIRQLERKGRGRIEQNEEIMARLRALR